MFTSSVTIVTYSIERSTIIFIEDATGWLLKTVYETLLILSV